MADALNDMEPLKRTTMDDPVFCTQCPWRGTFGDMKEISSSAKETYGTELDIGCPECRTPTVRFVEDG